MASIDHPSRSQSPTLNEKGASFKRILSFGRRSADSASVSSSTSSTSSRHTSCPPGSPSDPRRSMEERMKKLLERANHSNTKRASRINNKRFSANSNLMNLSIPQLEKDNRPVYSEEENRHQVQLAESLTRMKQLESQVERLTLQNVRLQRANRLLKVEQENNTNSAKAEAEERCQVLKLQNVRLQRANRLLKQELDENILEIRRLRSEAPLKEMGPQYEFLVQQVAFLHRQLAGNPACSTTCCFTEESIKLGTASSVTSGTNDVSRHVCRPVIHSTNKSDNNRWLEIEQRKIELESALTELEASLSEVRKQRDDAEILYKETLASKEELGKQYTELKTRYDSLQNEEPKITEPQISNNDTSTVTSSNAPMDLQLNEGSVKVASPVSARNYLIDELDLEQAFTMLWRVLSTKLSNRKNWQQLQSTLLKFSERLISLIYMFSRLFYQEICQVILASNERSPSIGEQVIGDSTVDNYPCMPGSLSASSSLYCSSQFMHQNIVASISTCQISQYEVNFPNWPMLAPITYLFLAVTEFFGITEDWTAPLVLAAWAGYYLVLENQLQAPPTSPLPSSPLSPRIPSIANNIFLGPNLGVSSTVMLQSSGGVARKVYAFDGGTAANTTRRTTYTTREIRDSGIVMDLKEL
ncbi:uncharacterized protein VTP21DRAFT_11576 [Calcarisporiella thermophila]|uniref:uncharacterized protein n=1 Tax=Calcarisporiella thermophila TaxID=911321 RepID=UPI0037428CAA